MEKALAKLGRENHLNTLLSRLPLLTIIYAAQCFLIYSFVKGINLGEYALFMGVTLIFFVAALFIHDKYHHVLLYSDHILIYFEPLNTCKRILYEDIDEIIVPEKECDFSSILIKLKSNDHVSLHFIDYPLQVKKVINEIKEGQLDEKNLQTAA